MIYISDDGDDSHELRDTNFRSDSDEDGNEVCSKRRRKKEEKGARQGIGCREGFERSTF